LYARNGDDAGNDTRSVGPRRLLLPVTASIAHPRKRCGGKKLSGPYEP
jgi:hypothetical protein